MSHATRLGPSRPSAPSSVGEASHTRRGMSRRTHPRPSLAHRSRTEAGERICAAPEVTLPRQHVHSAQPHGELTQSRTRTSTTIELECASVGERAEERYLARFFALSLFLRFFN